MKSAADQSIVATSVEHRSEGLRMPLSRRLIHVLLTAVCGMVFSWPHAVLAQHHHHGGYSGGGASFGGVAGAPGAQTGLGNPQQQWNTFLNNQQQSFAHSHHSHHNQHFAPIGYSVMGGYPFGAYPYGNVGYGGVSLGGLSYGVTPYGIYSPGSVLYNSHSGFGLSGYSSYSSYSSSSFGGFPGSALFRSRSLQPIGLSSPLLPAWYNPGSRLLNNGQRIYLSSPIPSLTVPGLLGINDLNFYAAPTASLGYAYGVPFPAYGFVSPVWPGSGIVPSVSGINLYVTSAPSSGMTTHTIVPSRPTPGITAAHLPDVIPAQNIVGPVQEIPDPRVSLRPPPGASRVTVINEFPPVERDARQSRLPERIQSLRYQSTGDDWFRKGDSASAEVFYRTAIESAPDRRAPYLRMAVAQISLRHYADAIGYLKAGLLMDPDSSRAWLTADEVYGNAATAQMQADTRDLWNWLAQEPLSNDRLLLASAFLQIRGLDGPGRELMELVSQDGPEVVFVAAMQQLVAEDAARMTQVLQASHDLVAPAASGADHRPLAPAGDGNPQLDMNADRTAAPDERTTDGIFMRGAGTRRHPAQPPWPAGPASAAGSTVPQQPAARQPAPLLPAAEGPVSTKPVPENPDVPEADVPPLLIPGTR